MKIQEIREKYPPRQLESQVEFDRMMSEMNQEQTQLNHPYLDRDRELDVQRQLLKSNLDAIRIQLHQIRIERLELEQKRKEINRVFHDLKHDLIMLNPREKYAKANSGENQGS